jgi:hypothetical protein
MQSVNLLPCAELSEVLLSAYGPCSGFGTTCRDMRWIPARGLVPRGFCGGLGHLRDVELVLIAAGPGDPHEFESYSEDGSPQESFEKACR